jgi:hypothetical protein
MADQQANIVIRASDRTREAFASAQRNLGNLEKGITRLNALPAALAGVTAAVAAVAASFELINPRPMIDLGDELAKLSQRTGIGVDKLDALRYAGQLADVEFDAMGKTLARLNVNIAAAAAGEEEQADAFRKMGVAVVDANGKVRNQYDVLLDVADALSGYEDGANKVALVNAAMSKSGVAMIPLLNGGAAAIRESAEELDKLRGTIDPEFARRSEQFNDNMTKLGVAAERLKLAVASGLLPGLVRYSEELVTAAKNSDLLGLAMRRLPDFLTLKTPSKFFADLAGGPDKPEGTWDAPDKPKTEAPALDAPGAKAGAAAASAARAKALAQALATERRVTDRHLKAIQTTQAATQDTLRFGQQYSQALYEAGLTSLEKYYADQDAARQGNLEAVRKAVADEIAIRTKEMQSPLLAGADKADEREAIATQIESARDRLRAAQREADQAGQLVTLERGQAVQQLRDDVAALDAQIHDLATGKTVEADLLGIAQRVRDANRLLLQAGASPEDAGARAADLGAKLTTLQRLNTIREQFTDLTDAAANAEARLAATESQRGDGLLEAEGRIRDVRTRALGELEKLIEATRELANQNPQNTPLQKYLADLQTQALGLRAALDPTKLRLDQAANDIGATLAAGLERAAFEGGKVSDMLKQIGLDVLRITTNELVTKPAATAFSNIVKGAGGQGTGENILGQLGQLVGLIPAGQGTGAAATSDASAQAAKNIESLATAAGGSADVLGQLPSLAAIPATTALGSLAGAAHIAAAALAQIGGGAAAGKSASLLDTVGSLFGGTGGGFGSGTAFGNQDLGQYFDTGGYTGNAGVAEAAGIVHGKEYVFSAPATRAIGVGRLDAMHAAAKAGAVRLPGFAAGGFVGATQRRVPGYAQGGYVGAPGAAAGAAPGIPARAPLRPVNLVQNFYGPADRRTVQQAAVDGMRAALASSARGTA